jgi:hypothetical protein
MEEFGAFLIGIGVLIVVCVLGYGTYWWTYQDSTERQNNVDVHSEQRQAGDTAAARSDYLAWTQADDPGQKITFADRFCAEVQDITQLPNDLVSAKTKVACP